MRKPTRVSLLLLPLAFAACSDQKGGGTSVLPSDVESIIFLQRAARNDGVGNVFDYTSYLPGGRIVKLEPPTPNGKLTVLTADPMFAKADYMAWDLSFDAKTIAFSARLDQRSRYHIFTMGVDGTNIRQITEGDYDYVYPVFLPGQKLMFATAKVVEEGTPQFRDEYERQTTAQMGVVNQDGTAEVLGPRNVSHRVSPSMLPDGRVIYTEWLHLGEVNDGHLRIMNADMTGQREAFGGEGKGLTNSYLKARYVSTQSTTNGGKDVRIITIGTSRDDTLQSGKLILVDLGAAEAEARTKDLTPDIPGDRDPSRDGIGRYYDAEIVGNSADLQFLVSWADGPVESELLARANTNANFGLYLLDTKAGTRRPVYDDPMFWDVLARPVVVRPEPPITGSPVGDGSSFTVGALNVYDTSTEKIPAGSAVKVRLLEGFSTEEGFPDMFGLSEFDGQSRYGEVPVHPDGSFAAKVPANVPLHMQVIDKFAVALANEPVWISGRAGEQRFCGGCHEDRAKQTQIAPGSIEAVFRLATNLDVPRTARVSFDYSYEQIRGVPWDKTLQPIFDAKCVSCHDGDASKPGNPSYTVTDNTLGTMQTFVFDLRGVKMPITVGERMTGDFTASHVSLLGVQMELGENDVTITGTIPDYVEPGSAMRSKVIEKLNPPQQFPAADTKVRRYPGKPVHPADVGGQELTALEYYQLILNIDMGAQFYFRENKTGGGGYQP